MDRLSLRVLGAFDVDGADSYALGSRKARRLLRLLALSHGRVVGASDLVDALWGGSPPARPADQLSVLASRLRRTLGRERIERVEQGYRLRYDWLDADELAALTSEIDRRRATGNRAGAAAASVMAMALIRSDIPVEDDDPVWALEAIAELRALARRARGLSASALLEAGSWLEAADLAEIDVRQDPFDEDAVRLVMRANASGGRTGVALAAYAALRRHLVDELGSDPSPETSMLHRDILRGAVSAARDPVRRSSGFVGRKAQLAHLDTLVSNALSGDVQMALIVGEPGIGKSTLMSVWAESRQDAGDTVLACTCGPLDRSVPLDALFVALTRHLQQLDGHEADVVLGPEKTLLAPLLGLDPVVAPEHHPLVTEAAATPALLHAALGAVLSRLPANTAIVITIDDAHLAGPALLSWLSQLDRSPIALVVVVACRVGEHEAFDLRDVVELGPLDRAAAAELVGDDRVDALFERSLGHPLFLSQLADADGDELPESLVETISKQCDQLGESAPVVRAAAVLGPTIDLDLLSTVLNEPAVRLLEAVESAARRGLLIEQGGEFAFRHDLVRTAIAEGVSAGRTTLLHREAGRALATRPDADPIRVAEHAKLGRDVVLAARCLRWASRRAADRFDPATAESLLDESLELRPDPQTRLERARIRTLRADYPAALADVEACVVSEVAAFEVGAWAAYFHRDFAQASQFAADGVLAADGVARTRCLMAGGRIQHARGDLGAAEPLLVDALDAAVGSDRVAAAAWLGVLRAHQSRVDEAIALLRPAASARTEFEQTSATLHALLFTGHALALVGRPALALEHFDRYTVEVDRRHVPRFAARGLNFGGWVLRNVGEPTLAAERHHGALDDSAASGTREVRVAALEDLAEDRLRLGEVDAASAYLDAAEQSLGGDLVFGWRLEMKLRLLRSRAALDVGSPEMALELARGLSADAGRVGVPRYSTVADLVAQRALHALGEPVDHRLVERTLRRAHEAVGLEWWWAGEMGAALGVASWIDQTETWADELALLAGPHETALRKEADRRISEWRMISVR